MRKRFSAIIALLLLCAILFTSCQGIAPTIGANGNWFIGDEDTGVSAKGEDGEKGLTPTIEISNDGFWIINGNVTAYKAIGSDGKTGSSGKNGKDGEDGKDGITPTIEINTDGYWVINGKVTTVKAIGVDGKPGESTAITILSCERTASSENGEIDTYTMTFSDGSTTTFDIYKNVKPIITVKEIKLTNETENSSIFTAYFTDDSEFSIAANYKNGAEESSIMQAYNTVSNAGYKESFNDFVLESINLVMSKFGGSSSLLSHAELITMAIPEMLLDWTSYFTTDRTILSKKTIDVVQTSGWVSEDGKIRENSETQNYVYTQRVPVNEDEVIEFKAGNKLMGLRFLTAFDSSGTVATDLSVIDRSSQTKNYKVPAGCSYVVATFVRSETPIVAEITTNEILITLSTEVTAQTISKLVNTSSGSSSGGNVSATVPEILISAALGSSSIVATTDKLVAGQYIELEENHIMNNKQLTLSFKLDEFGSDNVIMLGHGGENDYGGSWLELTSTTVTVKNHANNTSTSLNQKHNLTLKDYVNISIDVGFAKAKITISTSTGMYQTETDSTWYGRKGKICAVSTKADITNVRMRWDCSDYSKTTWLFGDSYFHPTDGARWTSYLIKNGYTNFLMSSYSGRASKAALTDFKTALKHGTPKYAVWCMGMNDADSATAISANYLSATQEFLQICNEKGITPILATIPCVPERNHTFKNKWIKESGYRYVDFAMAVGGEETGSSWYAGMLHTDNVHPATAGAKALYAQFLVDFPEIMKK